MFVLTYELLEAQKIGLSEILQCKEGGLVYDCKQVAYKLIIIIVRQSPVFIILSSITNKDVNSWAIGPLEYIYEEEMIKRR